MELMSPAKKREEADLRSPMVATTRVSFTPTRYQDTVIITGLTESSTRENGLRTKWKAKEFFAGRTESDTRVTSLTTNAKVTARLSGRMADSILVNGKMASSMESVHI